MTIKTDDIFRYSNIQFASLLLVPIVLTMITVDISDVMSSKNENIDTTKDIVYPTVPNVTTAQYQDVTTVPTPNVTTSPYQDVVETNAVSDDDNVIVPEFHVALWKYSADCGHNDFLGSCQPQKYIMPNNEVVQYVASIMTINEKGRLLWEKCPFGGCGIFDNNYVSDDEQFGHPPKGDYWVNPDYYFLNRIRGDCEDSAFAVASVLEAKGIRTKIVGGYTGDAHVRDWVVEYKINGTYYRYYGGIFYSVIDTNGAQGEVGFKKRDTYVDFSPVVMFGRDTYYQDYTDNW